MKIIGAILLLAAMSSGSPAVTHQPAEHHHIYSSCKGIANVPGYNHCKK